MPEKTAKPLRKRIRAPKTSRSATPEVEHADIAQRAYFIYLNEGSSDELANWLRAERELVAA